MSVKQAFEDLQKKMNENPEGIQRLSSVYQFDLTDDVTYQIVFKEGQVFILEDVEREADCTLQLSSGDVLKFIDGKLNTTMAFMTGKLKVKGDITLALKLQSAIEKYR
ncbi:SCP2 sterol-binding domain-containing protein [Sutcliffiella cohnii]|uniref:SCP2 domain-containing protein n=1 Tax=Sutcliffiella cohnii TaxID=33932 RepID=A0A223KPQ5_9BACI|nr:MULTISPECIES: SCP2 sterol-binding domain-containing protein [Sutcliffiella]AST91386.1 hypothetical protein BC6307_08885 [Sutcliffiella cohnii]MED4015059.1 SCP2 sterol-binding domain-containing protein [Sutcliffiella cohnii]WBL17216.1 SCP2 sterol-binding domain-containing protein [Sutcliffiella sp. NC1]